MMPFKYVKTFFVAATLFWILWGIVIANLALADNPHKSEYIAAAKAQEWKHELPRGLVVATCEQESRWDPFAESDKGALGLCQIRPSTFTDIIRQFQRDNDLEVDGIVGPRTWAALRPGVPYRYQSIRQRLMDPFQSVEYAAIFLGQIQRLTSDDPVIMMGVYYGGAGHHMVKYQREVMKRWAVHGDL